MAYRHDDYDADGGTDKEQRQQDPGQDTLCGLPSSEHVQGKQEGHSARQRQLVRRYNSVQGVLDIGALRCP